MVRPSGAVPMIITRRYSFPATRLASKHTLRLVQAGRKSRQAARYLDGPRPLLTSIVGASSLSLEDWAQWLQAFAAAGCAQEVLRGGRGRGSLPAEKSSGAAFIGLCRAWTTPWHCPLEGALLSSGIGPPQIRNCAITATAITNNKHNHITNNSYDKQHIH